MRIALFSFLLIFSAFAGAQTEHLIEAPASPCEVDLSAAPLTLAFIEAKGVDLSQIRFRFQNIGIDDFEISMWRGAEKSAILHLSREHWEKRELFRSSQIFVSDEGKGLGSMLYLVGARLLHEYRGARLRSEMSRSEQAINAWHRFLRAGIAEEVDVFFLGQTIERYAVFRPDRVVEASAQVYAFFLARLENSSALDLLRRTP